MSALWIRIRDYKLNFFENFHSQFDETYDVEHLQLLHSNVDLQMNDKILAFVLEEGECHLGYPKLEAEN